MVVRLFGIDFLLWCTFGALFLKNVTDEVKNGGFYG